MKKIFMTIHQNISLESQLSSLSWKLLKTYINCYTNPSNPIFFHGNHGNNNLNYSIYFGMVLHTKTNSCNSSGCHGNSFVTSDISIIAYNTMDIFGKLHLFFHD